MIIRLCIEEDNNGSEKKGAHNLSETKANFVERGQGSKFRKANNKGKCNKLGPGGGISEKKKFQKEMLQLWEARSQIFGLQISIDEQTQESECG